MRLRFWRRPPLSDDKRQALEQWVPVQTTRRDWTSPASHRGLSPAAAEILGEHLDVRPPDADAPTLNSPAQPRGHPQPAP
jgi:hypothetical protein